MKSFYFKCKLKYLNGEAKNYTYYKIDENGTQTTISLTKRTIAFPKGISIPQGFEAITEKEFIDIKKQLDK